LIHVKAFEAVSVIVMVSSVKVGLREARRP